MKPEDLVRELTRLFSEWRLADEASAPGFRQFIERARAGRKDSDPTPGVREGRWAWRAAVAAAASLALAIGLYLLRASPEPRLPSNAPTLAEWKAPSDVLLQTPGKELLGLVPVLFPRSLDSGGDPDRATPGTRQATPRSTQTKVPPTKGVES